MKTAIYNLIKNNNDYSSAIARLFLGIVIIPHGAQKVLGIWGGHGLNAAMDSFQQWFGIPSLITVLVALGEFAGGILLVLGLFSRFASAAIILIMLGAIYYVVHDHFFMNWYSQPRGEGFEFHILMIGIGLVVLINGSGKYSLDSFLVNKFYKQD